MAGSFASDLDAWVRKSEARMLAVSQEAAQTLAREANRPRDKGGRMPVDTGFLSNSLQGELRQIPRGPADPPKGFNRPDWDSSPVVLAINRMQLGDDLYLGYTARYARAMEARYAFVRMASQNWPQYVTEAAMRARQVVR